MRLIGPKSRTSAAAALAALLCLLTTGSAAEASATMPLRAAQHPAGVTWLTSLSAARDAARKTGKPILVDFSATWCGPCQAMIHETFPDPLVAPLLGKLVCVRIDVDQDQRDAQQFHVDGIPRLLVLPPNASAPRMDVTGYEDPATFASDLRAALGLPPLPGSARSAPPQPAADSPAQLVTQALESNTYGKLKARNKAVAAQGLQALVAQLGEPADAQPVPLKPEALARAGQDAVAALLAGMSSNLLAERVGAYAMYRRLARTRGMMPLRFDPWAPKPARTRALAQLAAASGGVK